MKNGSLLNVPLIIIVIFRNERDVHQSVQDLPLQVRQLCNNFCSDILRIIILAFNIKSDMKQDCVLASNLFGILFSLVLKHALGIQSKEGIICTQGQVAADSRTLQDSEQTPRCVRPSWETCWAQQSTHILTRCAACDGQILPKACEDSSLVIRLKKTNVPGQVVDISPVFTIDNYERTLIVIQLSLDPEINKRIGKTATTLGWLTTPPGRTPSWPFQSRWQCATPA